MQTASLAAMLAALLLSGLSSGCLDSGPHIVSLHVEADTLDNDNIVVTAGSGTNLIGVYGLDHMDRRIPLNRGLSWLVVDYRVLWLEPLGEAALCVGIADWFNTPLPPYIPPIETTDGGMLTGHGDAAPIMMINPGDTDASVHTPPTPLEPHEPETMLAVSYGELRATVRVTVVINAAGTWRLRLNDRPDIALPDLVLRQRGREVADDILGISGKILGNAVALQYGPTVTLEGTFLSRDIVVGTSDALGSWTAERRP